MSEDNPNPQINSAKIRVGGGIAGAIFTIGSLLIFLIGIPVLWYVFPAAIVLGCGVALLLRFARHDHPGSPWLLSAPEKNVEAPQRPDDGKNTGRSARALAGRPVT